jgi:DNA-binding NtrC family response regulator
VLVVPETPGQAPAASLPRVLLIDDDAPLRRALRRRLRRGCTLVEAESCERALEVLEAEGDSFRLVLLDVHFGEGQMRGDDCLPIIRERWPFLDVIMLTVDLDGSTVLRAWNAGAHAYVPKTELGAAGFPQRLQALLVAAAKRREAGSHERAAHRLLEEARHLRAPARPAAPGRPSGAAVAAGGLDALLREQLDAAMRAHGGNLRAAAASLQVNYHAFRRKARKLGLVPPRPARGPGR